MQVTEQTPGVYVPQIGDRVVYLQQGHKMYHERLRDKRRGPWDTIVSTAVIPTTQEVSARHIWSLAMRFPSQALSPMLFRCQDPPEEAALQLRQEECHLRTQSS